MVGDGYNNLIGTKSSSSASDVKLKVKAKTKAEIVFFGKDQLISGKSQDQDNQERKKTRKIEGGTLWFVGFCC